MNEIEKLQAQILEMNDKIQEKDNLITDLNQYKETYETEKNETSKEMEELRKINRDYFSRLIAQDKLNQNGKEIETEEPKKVPVDWSNIW